MFSDTFFKKNQILKITPQEIPFYLFENPGSVLLESALLSQKSRYSVWGLFPSKVLSGNDPASFKTLKKAFDECWFSPDNDNTENNPLPFSGGWIGFFSYEAYGHAFKNISRKPDLTPLFWFGYYEHFYVYDHLKKEGFLVSSDIKKAEKWFLSQKEKTAQEKPKSSKRLSNIRADTLEKKIYLENIHKIKEALNAGDCYQVNFSQRFEEDFSGKPYSLYRKLMETNPAPYAAYLNIDTCQILSSSPECFLEIEKNRILTRPIKGTRARGGNSTEDLRLKNELLTSSKDQAELLMITDLERNDLGKICVPGSIRVPQLSSIETFKHVHHQVSEVEGKLLEKTSITSILESMFPGGSITGAPKQKSMQIIESLESHPRNAYCGAIGYVSRGQKAQFNIAIRTMIIKDEKAYYYSGGGIVIDSDPESEYNEMLVKAKGMKEALT